MIAKIKCPVCAEEFNLESDLEASDTFHCAECEALLEIVSVDPLRVKAIRDRAE
ncbi:MAG: lysine biosynthesis protein LysW [Candidatus Omnitrophica bacterium]|nr:lysine biosynthesis protein LysW [Candidatus Omnitrophota bacterium]